MLLACAGPVDRSYLDTDDPVVERESDDSLVIHWRMAPESAEIPVYAGTVPGSFNRAEPVATLVKGRARISGLDPATRFYFEIAAPGSKPLRVAERKLPLEGAHNFRDLGGYRGQDGRRVRWGVMFRSDALGELSDSDLDYVSRVKLRLVCDFRSPKEREAAPDRLPERNRPSVAELAIYDESFDPEMLRERILSGDLEGLDLAQMLVNANREFARRFTAQYAKMFESLLQPGNLPAVIHCTAGKDRAGFGSAILLLALGVDRETVFEDFLLTNTYIAAETEKSLRMIRIFSLFRADPEKIRPVLGVRREYLEAGLDEIDKRFGSFEAYLHDGLGLSAGKISRLRERLLE